LVLKKKLILAVSLSSKTMMYINFLHIIETDQCSYLLKNLLQSFAPQKFLVLAVSLSFVTMMYINYLHIIETDPLVSLQTRCKSIILFLV